MMSMETDVVINQGNANRYTIEPYNLKVLQCNLPDLPPVESGVVHKGFKSFDEIEAKEKQNPQEESFTPLQPKVVDKNGQSVTGEPAPQSMEPIETDQESKDELIESLLKKADEFSDKYLKAQMEYEELVRKSQENEERIRQEAFAQGQESAQQEMQAAIASQQEGLFSQLEGAVATLQNESSQFQNALHSVKEELVAAALDIAKEVIQKELSDNAASIALSLAQSLIEDLDRESRITLKVHPDHVNLFQSSLGGNDHITVTPDKAVALGGVIVISKTGTIEADIMSRYEQIKRSALH